MKAFADIVAGLWSALCIAAEVAWDYGIKFWNKRTSAQQSVLIAVVIVLVALSVARVARAENAPASNFGVYWAQSGELAYACYMSRGAEDPKVGTIYTCLILQKVGRVLVAPGMVTFCTVTSYKGDQPWMDCGGYDEMRKLAGGI